MDAQKQRTAGPPLTELGDRNADVLELHCPVVRIEAGVAAQEVHRRGADEVSDEHGRRPVVNLLRRADLLDPAGIHHRNAVCHRHRFMLIVGDVDGRRRNPIMQIAQLAAHQLPKFGIKRAERLIHQKGFRPPHHGAA